MIEGMVMGDTARRSRLAATKKTTARDRPPLAARLIALVLVVVTVETLIYPSQNLVPGGVFSFSAGSFNVRLLDLMVAAVSASALFAKRPPKSFRGSFYLWFVASAIYVAIMAYLGTSNGASAGIIFTESRFLTYVMLLVPLAGVVSGDDLLGAGATALKLLSVPLAVAGVLSFSRVTPIAVPGFPASTFGLPGGDIGSIVGVLALCYVGKRALEGKASWAALWILYPLVSNQRASIVCTTVLAFIAILFIWFKCGVFGPAGNRKIPVPAVVSALAVIAAAALALLMTGEDAVFSPIFDAIVGTFTSQGKVASADTRTDSLAYAVELFQQQPVSGYGLGQGVQFFDVYRSTFVATDSAHNFAADVLVRGGVLGSLIALGLFASAFAGPRPWPLSRHVWLWILATVMSKGLLEPAFDKYRLAFLIALALTAIVITRPSASPESPTPVREPGPAGRAY